MKIRNTKRDNLNARLTQEIIQGAKKFKIKEFPSSVRFQLANDPKHLGFLFARHKIVGKLLRDKKRILEVGCQDGFGTYLVSQYVDSITGIDIEEKHIKEAKKIWKNYLKIQFLNLDITKKNNLGKFDSIFMLDVFEHISPLKSNKFLQSVIGHMSDNAMLIVGMPTKESQVYASKLSKLGHINLFTIFEAKLFFDKFFKNVLIFGMNDENLNLNFEPLNHYMMIIGIGPKDL
jgi:2-polyprenyl-3-methyl-5-hydroxy-6-metoxy-1,4-benzoquinol methylase